MHKRALITLIGVIALTVSCLGIGWLAGAMWALSDSGSAVGVDVHWQPDPPRVGTNGVAVILSSLSLYEPRAGHMVSVICVSPGPLSGNVEYKLNELRESPGTYEGKVEIDVPGEWKLFVIVRYSSGALAQVATIQLDVDG